jgi:general nucleoside transport system ATP-binding protein
VTANPPAIRLDGVCKSFGATVALDGVSLEVAAGEIHGLLGENGAGKSTLMNVLYGLLTPDSGAIHVDGRAVRFRAPAEAIRAGVGMVHQHFMLIPTMTVAENVLLGMPDAPFWRRPATSEERVARIARDFSIDIDVTRRVDTLPVGMQQRVEILKCLARDARTLVFDEPTAVLTPLEAEALGETLRGLRDAGRSVVFISHKLPEALALCDRITVIRRGRNVSTVQASDADPAALTTLMVGESVAAPTAPAGPSAEAEDALVLSDLRVNDSRGLPAARGVSLAVRAGEVFGIAGVDGNGQVELMDALAGVRMPESGGVLLDGADITRASPRERAKRGLAIVTDDRRQKDLSVGLSIAENLATKRYRDAPIARAGWLLPRAMATAAEHARSEYDIRADDVSAPVSRLSGGNQQKVVIARELSHAGTALVAMNPTRGLDVAAAAYVHGRLLEARAQGLAILLISTELDEVIALSDRIGVMRDGVVHVAPSEARSREALGALMVGEAPKP